MSFNKKKNENKLNLVADSEIEHDVAVDVVILGVFPWKEDPTSYTELFCS